MDDITILDIGDLAFCLAYLRWRNSRRAKRGAQFEPSAKAISLWFKSEATSATESVIIEAATSLSGIGDGALCRILLYAWLQDRVRTDSSVKRGRPRKRLPLMALAKKRVERGREPGRPSFGSPKEAAIWVAHMTGLKLRIFIDAKGTPHGSTPASALNTLRRAASAEGLDPMVYLDQFVSDREALADPSAETFGPPASLPTLARRLQRAKQRHPFRPRHLKAQK